MVAWDTVEGSWARPLWQRAMASEWFCMRSGISYACRGDHTIDTKKGDEMTTAEATTTNIALPYPEGEELHLYFGIGACQFHLVPGVGGSWLTGTYQDPAGALPCTSSRKATGSG